MTPPPVGSVPACRGSPVRGRHSCREIGVTTGDPPSLAKSTIPAPSLDRETWMGASSPSTMELRRSPRTMSDHSPKPLRWRAVSGGARVSPSGARRINPWTISLRTAWPVW